jgi:phenylalanyl-tRNA synthetase alpha subunit
MKKSADTKDYISSWELIENASLPLLILDPVWLALFPKEEKSPEMQKYERALINLIKKQSAFMENKKALEALKKKELDNIHYYSGKIHKDNDSTAKPLMKSSRSNYLSAKRKLMEAEEKLLDIEVRIQRVNKRLLAETINKSYGLMTEARKNIEEADEKAEALRKELKETIAFRYDNEEIFNNTYHLLHRLMGSEIIDALDRENI